MQVYNKVKPDNIYPITLSSMTRKMLLLSNGMLLSMFVER